MFNNELFVRLKITVNLERYTEDVTFFISSYVLNNTFGSWRNFQKSKMWSHTEPHGTARINFLHWTYTQYIPSKCY